MKRCRKILCICITVVLLLLIVGCSEETEFNSFAPQNGGYINYNNYYENYGVMDYCDGVLVYEKSGLFGLFKSVVKVNEAGEQKKAEGVSSPFQLSENGIVYKRNSKLIYRDQNDKETVIAENAVSFVVCEASVIYQKYERTINYNSEPVEKIDRDLYLYDLTTGKTDRLFEDPTDYVVYNNCVYVTSSGFNASLYKILLETREKQFVYQLDIKWMPYSMQISNDKLVVYGVEDAHFYVLDLNTLQESVLPINNAVFSIQFICEGDTIYYSYRGLILDGSFAYTDKEDEHNGTWKMNMITGEKERISKEYYSELYCFDKTRLYGYNDDNGITEITAN